MEGQEEGRARGGAERGRNGGIIERKERKGEGETEEKKVGSTYTGSLYTQQTYNTHLPFSIRFLTAGAAQEGSTMQARVTFGVGSVRFL